MIRTPALALALVLVVTAGCSREPGPPRIEIGEPCATCGMAVQEIRFAGLLRDEDGDRQYDSVECLVKDIAGREARVYLVDYDRGTLHAAESVWIVKGDFPTPMGGGLAAFASMQGAREVADRTNGRIMQLADLSKEAVR